MSMKCLLGLHSYGVPFSEESDGTVLHECMNCMRVKRSPIALPRDAGVTAALYARRSEAIAYLVAEDLWVGIPSNPTTGPTATLEVAPEGSRAATVLVARPQAA